MARFNDSARVAAAFTPCLHPGEQVQAVAYGVKQPPIVLIALLMLLGVLPGVIAVALMTREYVVAITNWRFIVLRFKGSAIKVKEMQEWRLDMLPPVTTSTGGLFTHIAVADPAKPFVAKFHRLGMPGQRETAMWIAGALAHHRPPAQAR